MEMSFGDKRVIKIFKDDKCVNIGVPQNKLILHLDSIGMSNDKEDKDKFFDISGNDDRFYLKEFDFDQNNGWLENNLHFDGVKTYMEKEYIEAYNLYSISISFHIPLNGKFIMTYPGIDKMYSLGDSLFIISGKNKIKISGVIEYNKFCNIIITYEIGRLTVYINGIKKYVSNTTINNTYNVTMSFGKVQNEYGEFMLHSVQFYKKRLTNIEIDTILNLEKSRYVVYYDKNLVLDARGYNHLINYGGFISIRDNSIHDNHIKTKDWYVHFNKARAFGMTGINSMKIDGRPMLLDSFTIEFMVSKIKHMFAEETFFLGKYKDNEYGIQISFNVHGLLIRIHNTTIFEYQYKLDYRNKRNAISISYNHKTHELCIYNNGYIVKKFKDINYKSNINDMTLDFVRRNGYFPFIGNINYIRIYNEAISSACITSNYNNDILIYR